MRQLFEPPLAEASELERADLLQASAASRRASSGFLAGPVEGAPSSGVDSSFAILHGLYWLCATWPPTARFAWWSTTRTGRTPASLRYLAFLLTRLEELDAALMVATRPRMRARMPSCSPR